MTSYRVSDGPKMLRETLCVAQSRIASSPLDEGRKAEHLARLERLIAECDRHRPLGPDGTHGDRHTATCGCLCRKIVSELPWWMGQDQAEPCRCLLDVGHKGKCRCEHGEAD